MLIKYLGQGFEPESNDSVGNYLKRFIDDQTYSSIFIISAFASASAVKLLSQWIDASNRQKSNYSIVVGIDQEGTSKSALEELVNLQVNSYVFFQKESPIFHPKIYLFEGQTQKVIIIGSSNLTGNGLFCNVESSILFQFDSNDPQGNSLLNDIKTYFSSIFNYSDPNLYVLTNALIDQLVLDGLVPTNNSWKQKYKKTTNAVQGSTPHLTIPKRKTAKMPSALKGKYRTDPGVADLVDEVGISQNEDYLQDPNYLLVWTSKPLTERDLNIHRTKDTHLTGSMTLSKGLTTGIDQRHYFYNNVFQNLKWTPKKSNAHILTTTCDFDFVIDGTNYGQYNLEITHNSDTTSASYQQKNSMTHLKWGTAKPLVSRRTLLGKTLYLLKNINSLSFVIEIQ